MQGGQEDVADIFTFVWQGKQGRAVGFAALQADEAVVGDELGGFGGELGG